MIVRFTERAIVSGQALGSVCSRSRSLQAQVCSRVLSTHNSVDPQSIFYFHCLFPKLCNGCCLPQTAFTPTPRPRLPAAAGPRHRLGGCAVSKTVTLRLAWSICLEQPVKFITSFPSVPKFATASYPSSRRKHPAIDRQPLLRPRLKAESLVAKRMPDTDWRFDEGVSFCMVENGGGGLLTSPTATRNQTFATAKQTAHSSVHFIMVGIKRRVSRP